jgi:hypothetical protein
MRTSKSFSIDNSGKRSKYVEEFSWQSIFFEGVPDETAPELTTLVCWSDNEKAGLTRLSYA